MTEPLRIGLIGCGAIARRAHLPAFRATGAVDVVAFASRSLASAEAASDEWGGGEVLTDWRELLARDDIDAVDICSPNALHAEQAIAAAAAGRHVLVEKPMACTVAEADAMIAAAAGAGVVLMPAHNVRFAPPFAAAREAFGRGVVGELLGVRAAFGHAGPHRWAPDAVWFTDASLSGGGALLDLGIHAADLLRSILAPHEVVEVAAMLLGPPAPGEVEQAAQVVLRFDNGAIGTLHASWMARPGPDHQLTVFGTEGTLHLDGRTPLTFTPSTAPDGKGERVPLPAPDRVVEPYAAFVRAASGLEPQPPVTAADGRAALAIVGAAYEAARSGRSVGVAAP
jgi:predicted dehydrogenase